jgi:hypothetical protein
MSHKFLPMMTGHIHGGQTREAARFENPTAFPIAHRHIHELSYPLLALAALTCFHLFAVGPPASPILCLETGMHTAVIRHIDKGQDTAVLRTGAPLW